MNDTAAFAASTFGKSLLWATVETYALFSLTDLFGIAPANAGALFVLLLLWSAVCDIVVGTLVDRRLSVVAANRLMRGAAPLAGVTFVLSLAPLSALAHPALALAAAILFRPLYSLLDVPHNSLLHDLGGDHTARVRLSAVRLLASTAASFAVSLGAIMLLHAQGGPDQAGEFRVFAVIIAILGTICFLATPSLVHKPVSSAPARLIDVARAGGVVPIFGATMVAVIGFSLFGKALPYIAQQRFADPGWTGNAMFAMTLGRLFAIPFWPWMAARRGARAASALAYGLCGLAAMAFTLLVTHGLNSAAALVPIGFAMGGASLLSWTLTAELAARLQDDGRQLQSSMFGLLTGLSKLALGVGGGALGLLLSLGDVRASGVAFNDEVLAIGGCLVVCAFVASLWLTAARQSATTL